MSFFHYVIFWFVNIIALTSSASVPPTWITSSYIDANSNRVINNAQTNNSKSPTPSATMTFGISFTTAPNLGYGLSNYQGGDAIREQMYQVWRTSLTATSFGVSVKIFGTTNIWMAQVRYIAISKSFPHHLNSFDNVPVQYNNGALSNITNKVATVNTYQNIINYTQHAATIGSSYNKFSLPLTNNKVLIFMTSLYLQGGDDDRSTTKKPLDLVMVSQPYSVDQYRLFVTYGVMSQLIKLHFSIIIFDQADVQQSGAYRLVYDKVSYPTAGGFYAFPSQFLTNLIVGFTQFSSSMTVSIIHFQTTYTTSGGLYGAQIFISNTRVPSITPLTRACFTFFYLKTWYCPAGTFFDVSTNMCIDCPIINCLLCQTIYVCNTCNTSAGYQVNTTSGQCQSCSITGCLTCTTNLTACITCDVVHGYLINASSLCQVCSQAGCLNCSTATTCYTCDEAANYTRLINGSCFQCLAGTFPNSILGTCDPCMLSNCITCLSLTKCAVCDTNNSFYLLMNQTCGFCNSSTNDFINLALDCQHCLVVECISCLNITSCLVCNNSAGYFINSSDNLCYQCNIVGCLTCSNLTACQACNGTSGYTLNTTTYLCDTCIPPQFYNISSAVCEICNISYCITCSSLTQCTTCDVNNSYYLLPDLSCGYCNSTMDKFINMSTLNCQNCSIPFCLDCSNATTCLTCDTNNAYYLNLTDNLCYPCSMANCLQCYNSSVCTSCNSSAGFQLNLTTLQCQPCTTPQFMNYTSQFCQVCSLSYCLTCSSLQTCVTCDYSNYYYLLSNLTCSYCDPVNDTFINMSSLGCQKCSIPNCLDCSTLTTCFTCNNSAGYYLNSTDDLCYPCSLSYCLQCQNLTYCAQCDEGNQYFLNTTTGQCQHCNLTGCLNCTSLTVCNQCDNSTNYNFDFTSPNLSLCGLCNVNCLCDGYSLPWVSSKLSCTSICGDGLIRVDQSCDDNNNISGDGCSSLCNVQKYWICDGAEPSTCNKTLYIPVSFVSIQKYGCNSFKAVVNSPQFSLSQIKDNIAFLNEGVYIQSISENNQNIQIIGEYQKSIVNQSILLSFNPGDLINMTYNPDIPALYYDQNQCNTKTNIEKMLASTQGISYGILIASVLSCKIVGLQLFGVLQLSYFTLSSHNFLNLYLAPLAKFGTFNGLNKQFTQQNVHLPQNISKLGIFSNFFNNCNIMLFVLFGELAIAIVIYSISKIILKKSLQNIAVRLLKQGFITLIIFNSFNVAYSAGIHWKYAYYNNNRQYILSTSLLVGTLCAMFISVVHMQITNKESYGQFKNKYKQDWICQLYIPLTVVYRAAIGFYIALRNEQPQSTLIVLSITFAFMMYIIVNLPFKDSFQNYRCSLIHLTMICILGTTNYYRSMKMNTPLQIKAKIYTPALVQLSLIVICMIVSFFTLCYEIYLYLKKCMKEKDKRKVSQQQKLQDQSQLYNLSNNSNVTIENTQN